MKYRRVIVVMRGVYQEKIIDRNLIMVTESHSDDSYVFTNVHSGTVYEFPKVNVLYVERNPPA